MTRVDCSSAMYRTRSTRAGAAAGDTATATGRAAARDRRGAALNGGPAMAVSLATAMISMARMAASSGR